MKSTTKWKLYEIKESIFRPFREIKRVVSQFFETEYFYRWKITTYPWFDDDGNYKPSKIRNVFHLNNTWDGSGCIFGALDDKLFHMYINMRKYNSQPDRYLNTKDISEFGTDEEKLWAFDKLAKQNLNDILDTDKKLLKNHNFKGSLELARLKLCEIDVPDSESADGIAEYYVVRYAFNIDNVFEENYRFEKVVQKDTGKTIKTTDAVEFCRTGRNVVVEKPYLEPINITILDLGATPSWNKIQEYFNSLGLKVDIKERALTDNYGFDSVNVEPKELLWLSNTLKSKMRGRIIGIHKIYNIRKDLNRLSDMDILMTEPYKSKYEKIMLLDNNLKKKKAFMELNETFNTDRKELGSKIMMNILDDSDWIE